MNINPQTGFVEASNRSARFTLWTAFLLFSSITMGSSIQVKNAQGDNASSSSRYAVFCSIVSFIATLIVVIVHFLPVASSLFIGTLIEGGLCFVLLLLWTAVVATITDATNGLVVPEDPTNEVQNANLYYSSWAGFFAIVYITIQYCHSLFGYDVAGTVRSRGSRLSLWSAMICTSIVVMGSSVRILKNDCNNPDFKVFTDTYCSRTRLGIAFGTIGVIVSIAICYLKVTINGCPFQYEAGGASVLSLFNAIGVFKITAAEGPGSSIGNLYYFSWGSCLLSAFILFNCYGEWSGIEPAPATTTSSSSTDATNGTDIEQQQKSRAGGDIEIETFDGNL